MRVSEAMTKDVRTVGPEQSICDAAKMMAECDVGLIPVGENDRLVGMVTDRDIAIRAVASGKAPDTKVREVMSEDVKYCFEDDDVTDAARTMADVQLHRLIVLNQDKRMVGIVALADIAQDGGAKPAGEAVRGISKPGSKAS